MAFLFFSNNLAALATTFLAEFLGEFLIVAATIGLLMRIAAVSFSNASLFALINALTCLESHLVSSATNSSVACAISSKTLFTDAYPVAHAVVAS